MKKIIWLMFVFFISTDSTAKVEKASICEPREPKINYAQAVRMARGKLTTSFSVEEMFIDLISLDCKNQKYSLTIGFRGKSYESGHLLIYIYMDGTTQVSKVVKDG